MKRIGKCNHCGDCCGANGGPNPWPSTWPETLPRLDGEAIKDHILFSWIPNPQISGHRPGSVDVDGTIFKFDWVAGVGLSKSQDNHECPFLLPYEGTDTGRCGLYGTPHHIVWEDSCNHFPPVEATMTTVIKIFSRYPNCSFKYIRED